MIILMLSSCTMHANLRTYMYTCIILSYIVYTIKIVHVYMCCNKPHTHTMHMHALVSTFYVCCSTHTCTPTHACARAHTHTCMCTRTHTHTHRCARPKALSPALTLSIGTFTYYCNVPSHTHLFCCTSFCMCTHAQLHTHTSLFPRLLPAFRCCIHAKKLLDDTVYDI